jgi:hypothetical protein
MHAIQTYGWKIMNDWDNDNTTASEHYKKQTGKDLLPDALYYVSWPDHVQNRKFNCDCDIRE